MSSGTLDAAPTPRPQVETPIGLAMQLRVASAMAVAGAIFWSVGWLVWQPADPRGPLVLYGAAHPLMTVIAFAALSIVSGGLGVIIAGCAPGLTAPSAVAVGLACLNLRGGGANLIGDYVATRSSSGAPIWPTMGLIVELWVWLGLIAVGAAAGRWVAGRAMPGPDAASASSTPRDGTKSLLAALLAAPLAYALITILGGSASDAVLKQQVYFSVGTACLLAVLAAQFVFRTSSAWWPLLTVGLVGSAAEVLGQPRGGPNAELIFRIIPSVVARPLPIEYAALGVVGGILGLHFAGTISPTPENRPAT